MRDGLLHFGWKPEVRRANARAAQGYVSNRCTAQIPLAAKKENPRYTSQQSSVTRLGAGVRLKYPERASRESESDQPENDEVQDRAGSRGRGLARLPPTRRCRPLLPPRPCPGHLTIGAHAADPIWDISHQSAMSTQLSYGLLARGPAVPSRCVCITSCPSFVLNKLPPWNRICLQGHLWLRAHCHRRKREGYLCGHYTEESAGKYFGSTVTQAPCSSPFLRHADP